MLPSLVVYVCLATAVTLTSAAPPILKCSPPCGVNAECRPDGTCACPESSPNGDPGFMCYASSRAGCFGFGDPQVTGFSSEESRIKFPCKVTLAQFDTPLAGQYVAQDQQSYQEAFLPGFFSGKDPRQHRCRVVVQSTTRMSPGGEYYTHSMDIKLIVNKHGLAESVWIHLEAGNIHYYLNGGKQVTLGPRDCATVEVDTRPVAICHLDSKGMWAVSAPDCAQTDIVFRPWDLEKENQVQVVGFGILTELSADFTDTEAAYPYSLCHVPPPAGSKRWYLDFYHSLGLTTRYGSFLYAFLLHPPWEEQPDQDCKALTNIFGDCPTVRHVGAVNTCSPILLNLALCAKGNGHEPLQAFHNCMKGYCSSDNGDEKALCEDAHVQVSGETCPDTPPFDCS